LDRLLHTKQQTFDKTTISLVVNKNNTHSYGLYLTTSQYGWLHETSD